MRTPREIYVAYTIMPSLQLHQLRVAAVGKLICENFKEPINTDQVVLACLFHDMGNIVKFDLAYFPEFLEPQGLQYWQQIKDEYVRKYGPEQHAATTVIAQEIGLPVSIIGMLNNSGFRQIPSIVQGNLMELKILKYADLRVGPKGVVTLDQRFQDFEQRYVGHTDNDGAAIKMGKQLEHQIFKKVSITPSEINDASVAPLIEELWEYTVA